MANWYLDKSATNNGDGTTAAQASGSGLTGAFNSLASAVAAAAAGDFIWTRRVTSSAVAGTTFTFNNLTIVGWPLSGDKLYSGRPATGTSNGWDSDSATYAQLSNNTVNTISGNGNRFYRLQLDSSGTTSIATLVVSGYRNSFTTCVIKGNATTNTTVICLSVTGNVNKFYSCTVQAAITGSASTDALIAFGSASRGNLFINTTVICDSYTQSTATCCLINLSGFKNTVLTTSVTVTSSTTAFGAIIGDANSLACFGCRVHDVTVTVPTTFAGFGIFFASNSSLSNVIITNFNSFTTTSVSTTIGVILNFASTSAAGCIFQLRNCKSTTTATQSIIFGGIGNQGTFNGCTFNSATTDIAFNSTASGCQIYCDSCLFSTTPVATFATGNDCFVYSSNHNNQTGYWYAYFHDGFANSSNVARSGGASYGVRLAPTSDMNESEDHFHFGYSYPGPQGGSQQSYVAVTSGSRTITVYGAYKGWSSTDLLQADDVWIESQYQKSNGDIGYLTTQADAILTSDSSTWSNESGYTAFKMVITFTAPSSQNIPIRINLKKQFENAVVYIDPTITVA